MKLIKNVIYIIKQIFIDTYNIITSIVKWIINFLGPVEDAVYGAVNEKEFYRVISGATAVTGGFWELCKYLYYHTDQWISNETLLLGIKAFIEVSRKNWVFACVFLLLVTLEYIRRKGQGVSSQ